MSDKHKTTKRIETRVEFTNEQVKAMLLKASGAPEDAQSSIVQIDGLVYTRPTPQEAPSEVTEEQLQRAIKAWFENPFRKTSEAMRAALTAALQGDRS